MTTRNVVESRRLDHRADVRSRLFPKTRSWLALGAPLHLLTPLSLLRIVLALFVLPWPALVLLAGLDPTLRGYLVATTGVAAVGWVVLLKRRSVSLDATVAVTVAGAVLVGGLAALGPGTGATVAYSLLLFVLCATAAVFLRGRRLLVHQGLVCAAYLTGLVIGQGARGIGTGVAGALALIALEYLVVLLGDAARRHDVVDHLTGLANGHGLAAQWRARTGTAPSVIAVVAIDGLDEARGALGWEVANKLLHRAVEDLGQVLPGGALIGRIEGDELVAATRLPDPDLPAGGLSAADVLARAVVAAKALAEQLTGAVASGRYLVDRIEVRLRAHVGLALSPWDGTDFSELVRRASLSAARAARFGDDHRIWDGSQEELTVDDLSLLADLRLAAGRGELWLAYQLQVASGSKRPVGVEALLRWRSPIRGDVAPDTFITLAERTGLIERITEWVLASALDAQVRWRLQGVELPVSVNLSAKLLTRTDLVEWIVGELDARALPAEVLTLEVTETAATANLSQAVGLLQPLHDRGVRVSMDDFGCGYTSLATLPHLPLDEMKVDRQFVSRSAVSPADEAIVFAIGDLARRLGVHSVAEGVEDELTAARLTAHGFDILQGYLYARPVDEDTLLVDLQRFGPAGQPPLVTRASQR